MRDTTMLQADWNVYHFAVGGFAAGAAYAFLMCQLVGLVALASLSVVFLSMVLGGLLGASIAGGVAAARNYFLNHLPSR